MAAPQLLTLEDCEEVARGHFHRDDVQVAHWKETKLGSGKPAGYLGDHKLVEIFASVDGKEESIHIFVKTVPENENQLSLIETTQAFKKEVLFYTEIFKAWIDSGIIPTESLAERRANPDSVPEPSWSCRKYIARDNLIVLENVAFLGYKSDSPRDAYDFEHALLAIKMLATFHAASLIFEEERSQCQKKPYRLSEEYPVMLQDTFYVIKEGHPGEETTEAGVVGLLECAKKFPICQNDVNNLQLVEERLPAVLRRMYDLVKSSPRYRNVLCHADLWQNNILFQRDDAGRPRDVVLVDFQLLRYAPPANDIFNLLHLSMRRSERERHEAELLDAYYATLTAALCRRGLNIEKVLPREDFNESLEEQRFAGRVAAAFILHFVLSDEESLGPVFRDPKEYARVVWEGEFRARMVCTQFDRDEVYRERMEELLMELLEKDVFV